MMTPNPGHWSHVNMCNTAMEDTKLHLKQDSDKCATISISYHGVGIGVIFHHHDREDS